MHRRRHLKLEKSETICEEDGSPAFKYVSLAHQSERCLEIPGVTTTSLQVPRFSFLQRGVRTSLTVSLFFHTNVGSSFVTISADYAFYLPNDLPSPSADGAAQPLAS